MTAVRPDDETEVARVDRPQHAARSKVLGSTFQPSRNSLNFLRLALAVLVIFSHAIMIGGFGVENVANKTTLGTLAVYGFFGISGFLIAGSATRHHVGRYLWQRFLRIFPAYWVCLVVTAFVFGLGVWLKANPTVAQHCGLSCYVHEAGGPLGYLSNNDLLQGNQSAIAHTLPLGYFRPVWNGSTWTLFFEVLCYLLLAALSVLGLLRHRRAVLALALSVWTVEIVITVVPILNQHFSPSQSWDVMKMLTFVPIFLAGSLLYLYRERIPDSGYLAAGSFVLFLSGFMLPLGSDVPAFRLTSTDLTAVFLVYPLIWLGIHLPLHRVGSKNDYSYGVYIYAYPVQQLLVVWGVSRWGYWPYATMSVLAVLPIAIASWWLIERHALRLKRLTFSRRDAPDAPV